MAKRPLIRATATLALAIAGTLLGTAPASAQSVAQAAAGSVSWAKTDAILGGAPSALQAILAQQSGIVAPVRRPLSPSSYSRPPAIAAAISLEPSPGVLNGRPDVFGSVALAVDHTPLDSRWQRVKHAGLSGAAARYAQSVAPFDEVQRLEAINRYVNRRVRFVDDERQYGRPDVWSTAANTLERGRGDCEDFAIAKFQMLRRAHIADGNLYLVIVKDLVRRADHAVLVVRAAGHMYVLDNGTDQLLDSESVSDYRPVLTLAENGSWTHGYRLAPASLKIASDE